MTATNRKVVALDIGGVCLRVHFQRTLDFFGVAVRSLGELPADCQPAFREWECGRLAEEDFVAMFRQLSGRPFSMDEVRHGWNLMIGEDIPGAADWVRELQAAGYHTVFFSNTSRWHLAEVRRKLSFADIVPDGIYSFEVGSEKPDPAIYRAFEERFGRPVAYFDDRAENVAAGSRVGWPSFVFTDVQQARKAFPGSGS
ncbi:MAG: HAD-IA family hydrolase [Lentisphaeria bacterium]